MKHLAFLALVALAATPAFAEVAMTTQSYPNNDAGFAEMAEVLSADAELNLLAFPGAKLHMATGLKSSTGEIVDGEAGVFRGEGRVQIGGSPSKIVYYLGRPRPISEISVFTGNGDTRANQDFEVRVANNAANPGEMPEFPEEPTFTSGDKVLGANGGGFKTTFADTEGKPIVNGEVDWVEFRVWQTRPVNAGAPAKEDSKGNDWTALVELQVLGDPNDPNLFQSEEERQAWLAERARKRIAKRLSVLGPDLQAAVKNTKSLELAIDDLAATYPEQYTKADEYKQQLAAYNAEFVKLTSDEAMEDPANVEKLIAKAQEFDAFRKEVLLANPLLDFETLLVRKSDNPGLTNNWISSCSRGKNNYGAAIQTISPRDPNPQPKTIIEPPKNSFIGDLCLHWDAERMLMTALGENGRWQIFEANVDGSDMKQVTPGKETDVDNAEACYAPDGAVIYSSTATMMGVPCVAGSQMVANLYRLEEDRESIRQITFEQDQDWCPVVMENGRIMYLRWEYTDASHYFTRILMTMNPDGTRQMSYYGSNSFWPNSLFFAKPIPGHATKFVGVVTGHHGTARAGELHVFDTSLGRKEADGVIQQIPGHGKKVEAKIVDRLVDPSWPKFLHPMPLSEKYFLVSCKMDPNSPWGIYLVDVFDNFVPILVDKSTGYFEPTPVVAQTTPRLIASTVRPESDEAVVYLSDIYSGPGLADVPKGEVKRLRLFSYGYGYRNIGGHDKFGMESSWDAKRILGTVPVEEDGSAVFRIPANTPIALQPLDEEGRSLQLMRSWLVAMPGEVLSCVGCHESQDTTPGARSTMASLKPPATIEPFYGEARPFNFEREVQPVLNKYCVGCHDGKETTRPNFADKEIGPRGFSNAYHALHRFVRRPGPESDVHVLRPLEYHASTSPLFQLLEKGHKNVEMDQEAWHKLYCWADLNVPYFGTWAEMADSISDGKVFRGNKDPLRDVSSRYFELRDLYATAAYDMEAEADLPAPTEIEFIWPDRRKPHWDRPTYPENWPLTSTKARSLQKSGVEETTKTITLDDGQEITLARIPAGSFVMGDTTGEAMEKPQTAATIEKPYWMMTTEVTNALFNKYFPNHDSRFIDQQWKDHTTPGYPHNKPEQPVIRVTWAEAMEFCRMLSEETGLKVSLPTEAQWEWACRAGSNTPMWFGGEQEDFTEYANLADESLRLFVVKGVNPSPVKHEDFQAFIPRAEGLDDGQMIPAGTAMYKANPWGLYDMHGNVAEWTLSNEKAYPYVCDDGRNAGEPAARKIVRGGSWRDRPEFARSGYRLGYEPWQRVFNVGFRVVVEDAE